MKPRGPLILTVLLSLGSVSWACQVPNKMSITLDSSGVAGPNGLTPSKKRSLLEVNVDYPDLNENFKVLNDDEEANLVFILLLAQKGQPLEDLRPYFEIQMQKLLKSQKTQLKSFENCIGSVKDRDGKRDSCLAQRARSLRFVEESEAILKELKNQELSREHVKRTAYVLRVLEGLEGEGGPDRKTLFKDIYEGKASPQAEKTSSLVAMITKPMFELAVPTLIESSPKCEKNITNSTEVLWAQAPVGGAVPPRPAPPPPPAR